MKDNKLIYSDTDSITLEKPLNKELISQSEIGLFKLEHTIIEAIYISPKFYCLKTINGEIILKTKGIKKGKLKYNDFINYIEGKDLKVKTTIFKKNLIKGTINIIEQDYTLNKKKIID